MDNFNGPVGIMVPVGIGLSRVNLCDRDCRLNFVPVDYITNSLISAIAQAAPHLEKNKKLAIVQPEVPIYNYGVANSKGMSISEVVSAGMYYNTKYPMENMFWYPGAVLTQSILVYKLFFYFAQILPAIPIDFCLRVFKHKFR